MFSLSQCKLLTFRCLSPCHQNMICNIAMWIQFQCKKHNVFGQSVCTMTQVNEPTDQDTDRRASGLAMGTQKGQEAKKQLDPIFRKVCLTNMVIFHDYLSLRYTDGISDCSNTFYYSLLNLNILKSSFVQYVMASESPRYHSESLNN